MCDPKFSWVEPRSKRLVFEMTKGGLSTAVMCQVFSADDLGI